MDTVSVQQAIFSCSYNVERNALRAQWPELEPAVPYVVSPGRFKVTFQGCSGFPLSQRYSTEQPVVTRIYLLILGHSAVAACNLQEREGKSRPPDYVVRCQHRAQASMAYNSLIVNEPVLMTQILFSKYTKSGRWRTGRHGAT